MDNTSIIKGSIFVMSAASGTGKTSLTRELIRTNPQLRVAVSHTTRTPRENEVNHEHYHFVDQETFTTMVGEGLFLEHAKVHEHYYGTSIAAVTALTDAGFDVILEIDVQGAEQIRRSLPDAVCIFVLPPSWDVLRERLTNRGTNTPEDIELRLKNARLEFEQATLFDYLVVNDRLEEATQNINHIIKASRFRQSKDNHTLISLLED